MIRYHDSGRGRRAKDRIRRTYYLRSDPELVDLSRICLLSSKWKRCLRSGACGEPDSVKMLMENGALYHFSFIESGILHGKLRTCIEAAGLDGFACLGLGNSLFFRAADSDWLMRKRDEYMQFSGESFAAFPNATLYKKWADFFRERIEENV